MTIHISKSGQVINLHLVKFVNSHAVTTHFGFTYKLLCNWETLKFRELVINR